MAYLGARPTSNFRVAPTKDTFTGDGSTTTFDLANTVPAGGENALQVFVENVRQEPGSGKAYTLGADGSGDLKRITFSSAPVASAEIYVITTFSNEAFKNNDIKGSEFVLDADGDTSITADTDDQIDIKIAGADDFKFSANAFNVLSGSTLTIDSGATITNSGTANGFGVALDDVSTGDAASTLATSAGNITIDAQGSDTDIIFKGTDGSSDTTFLTLDGSEAGKATFNDGIVTGGASNLEGGVVVNENSASVDFRVESNGDENCLIVDGSGDKVGIGEDVPEGKLHIFTGDASVGPNADADELVVEGSGNSGISILSGNSSNGAILFGDSGDDNIGIIDYDHNTNGFTFFANAQHFFKIASNGEVAVNDTEIATGAPVFKVKGALNNTVAIFDHRNTSGSEELFRFRDGDAQTCGSIDINPGANTVAFTTSSDYRLKQSEEDITDGITKVKQLKPYRFNWKSNPSGDKVDGFFAHEVSSIVPMAVRGTKDETQTLVNVVLNADGTVKDSGILQPDWVKGKTEAGGEIFASDTTWVAEKTGEPKYQVIDHSKLVPVLTAALKEAITKIEALEARVTTLEG